MTSIISFKPMRILKSAIVSFIMYSLIICSAFSVFALDGSFYLTSEEARVERLFQVNFVADCEDLSAFVAEIEFDSQVLAYRSVKSLIDGSEYSVNTSEDGKIVVAWLNEDGVGGYSELFSIEFKALSVGVTTLSLNVSQAISGDFADVSAVCYYLSLEILPKTSVNTKENSDKSEVITQNETANATSIEDEPLSKDIKGTPSKLPVALVSLLAVIVLIPCAVIIALKIPKKKKDK